MPLAQYHIAGLFIMKLTIEFDIKNEKDERRANVFLAAHNLEDFLISIKNEFKTLNGYYPGTYTADERKGMDKVMSLVNDLLTKYKLDDLV